MSRADFDLFVRNMLTDPKVVEHYHSYRGLFDLQQIRSRAEQDFWEHFEESRAGTDFEIAAPAGRPGRCAAKSASRSGRQTVDHATNHSRWP